MEHLLLVIAILLFLYFGYRDDFKRDKKGFVFTVIGVLAFGAAFILLNSYNSLIAFSAGIVLYAISQYLKRRLRDRTETEEL
ncbi:MAG: hypothetical protein AAFY48_16195 [Bacteroidota bacterium]